MAISAYGITLFDLSNQNVKRRCHTITDIEKLHATNMIKLQNTPIVVTAIYARISLEIRPNIYSCRFTFCLGSLFLLFTI
ncbi:hypothetical protein SEA_BECKERTON_4 [Mycobacterium phage Beckerton]|nr:hypothetical protein SEA_BECKERTON_4 [Mycobacterium phage Beckerton]